jgi:simple sugar transport system permease protein
VGLVVVSVTAVAAVLLASVGASPARVASGLYTGAFGSSVNAAVTVTAAVPLVLVALGWIITLRAGRIHIGFPGQIIIGGVVASAVALEVHGLPGVIELPAALLAGFLGGALYAGIAAYLWARRGVQEIVSTLLLNLIAAEVVAWVVRGPLVETIGGQPQSNPFPPGALWPTIPGIAYGSLSWDIVLIPVAVAATVFVLKRTTVGFRLRLVGANPIAARCAGYRPKEIGVGAIVVSGGLAGLAGACLLLAGQTTVLTDGFESGTGFNGIAVALLALNSPVGVIPSALLFAGLATGSDAVQVTLNVPSSIASILQGLVILVVLVAATVLSRRQTTTAGPALEFAESHPDEFAAVGPVTAGEN